MPKSLERELDGLYALPPGAFIAARQELAKRYRTAGDRESAERVKTARRPTLAAWTANQLARQERGKLRVLLNAGRRVRSAQRRALSGGSGAAEALREAADQEREVLRPLVQAGARILSEGGQRATETTLHQLERTLHAAARDEEVGEALRRGRLTHELDPTGFGPFSPADVKPLGRRKRAAPRKTERDLKEERRALELRQRIGELRRAVKAAERELAKAERSARAKERILNTARERLAVAESGAERINRKR
jgi:hypothetical protein